MTVEAATYVADLVPTNPVVGDPVSEGDDHIRLIKAVLQNTFPALDAVASLPKYASPTTSQSPALSDNNTTYFADATSGNLTITLPDSTSLAVPVGYNVGLVKTDGSVNTAKFVLQGSDVNVNGGSLTINFPMVDLKATYVGGHLWRISSSSRLGEMSYFFGGTLPPGALFLNGDTIGDASSGATHADASYMSLFIYLWRTVGNTQAPVSAGRGSTGLADWNVHKTLTLPTAAGKFLLGLGGIAAATINSDTHTSNADTNAGTGGEQDHVITVPELGQHSHTATQTGHAHTIANVPFPTIGVAGGATALAIGSGVVTYTTNTVTPAIAVANSGSNAAHNTMPPFLAAPVIIRMV